MIFVANRCDHHGSRRRIDIVENTIITDSQLPFGQRAFAERLAVPCFRCRFVAQLDLNLVNNQRLFILSETG